MSELRNVKWTVLAGLSLVLMVAGLTSAAEKSRALDPLENGLDGWLAKGPMENSKWTTGTAKVDPDNPRALVAGPAGDGPVELITAAGHGADIYTKEKFGDCTVEIELMVPQGSNSGVYLMGEYEIQVLDSFGKTSIGPGDMGGLYGTKPADVNASKEPGVWQKFVIEFVAPRFEGEKKIANARFTKVTLNGQVIHQDVEIQGKTGGDLYGKEVPEGSLMLQGNHGPVAFRNIRITAP
ncbi:MAG TPA: DUF1080 domain-containing protein [Thermoguttaceae bacterium]|nr:DUF1080 domain-containing protein [Thermoguttaceae bacterium]